jgi:CHASE3 domain sensor protein
VSEKLKIDNYEKAIKEILRQNKEIERLNKENEELKHKLKLINSYVYGCDIDSLGVDKE